MEDASSTQLVAPDQFYRKLGDQIRLARTRAGVTQEQLAAGVKLTRTSVTNIEKGRQRLLVHTLMDIAAVLQVKPEVLLPAPDGEVGTLARLDPAARRWIEEALATSEQGTEP